jgi:hypothetical protein
VQAAQEFGPDFSKLVSLRTGFLVPYTRVAGGDEPPSVLSDNLQTWPSRGRVFFVGSLAPVEGCGTVVGGRSESLRGDDPGRAESVARNHLH